MGFDMTRLDLPLISILIIDSSVLYLSHPTSNLSAHISPLIFQHYGFWRCMTSSGTYRLMFVLGPGILAVSCYLHREGIGLLYVDMVSENLREI